MVSQDESPANVAFVRELHRGLTHLYDPSELRRSRLIDLLALARGADPTSSLQRLLLQAIEALKPDPSAPPQANAWRIYHVLNQRYAGQFRSEDVATNLAISGRQLRRLQLAALHALGDYLRNRYDLDERLASLGPIAGSPGDVIGIGPDPPTREEELEWLRSFAPGDPVGVAEAVRGALATAGPLIQTSRVRVETRLPDDLPRLTVQSTAIRHALLSVLSAAIRAAEGGAIAIEASARSGQVQIDVRLTSRGCSGPGNPVAATAQPPVAATAQAVSSNAGEAENLEMARELVVLCGGSLELPPGNASAESFVARITLPAAEQTVVLVVEDNADTLRLLERYLAGSRYRFVGIRDPRQALATAEEVRPSVVVLDLMLPDIDGWELLGRLREHPTTSGVPIVVCSILPHEDLAVALGAAALIRKPVSREALLLALDRQTAARG